MATALDLEKLHLESGAHSDPDAGMCVMEAVAFMAGEPFSDHPQCASPAISNFLRSWNDSLPDADRQILKPYIPRLIGTNTGPEDEQRRAWLATDWLVRDFTPTWLDKAGLTEHAANLRALPELTSTELAEAALPVIEEARTAGAAARDAAWDAAWDAARYAARDAAWDAAWDAARYAARDAAWDAARDAARDAAWDAARYAARDAAWDAGDKAKAAGGNYDAQYKAAHAAAKPIIEEAFAETVKELQASALELLDRMITVSQKEPAAA